MFLYFFSVCTGVCRDSERTVNVFDPTPSPLLNSARKFLRIDKVRLLQLYLLISYYLIIFRSLNKTLAQSKHLNSARKFLRIDKVRLLQLYLVNSYYLIIFHSLNKTLAQSKLLNSARKFLRINKVRLFY